MFALRSVARPLAKRAISQGEGGILFAEVDFGRGGMSFSAGVLENLRPRISTEADPSFAVGL